MNVFRTLAIPTDLAAKAEQIAYDLGYPSRGMFISAFDDNGTPIGVMSTGILDSESPILADEFALYAAVIEETPDTAITQQDCIDFVMARDASTDQGIPRQAFLIEQVNSTETPPDWAQPTGAHDAYEVNAVVRFDGYNYTSLIDANVWAPDVTGWRINWGQGETGYPPWVQPLGAHDAYALDAKVSHVGKNWVSLIASNVWEPGSVGAESLWAEI